MNMNMHDPARKAWVRYYPELWRKIDRAMERALRSVDKHSKRGEPYANFILGGNEISRWEMKRILKRIADDPPTFRRTYTTYPKREFDRWLSELENFLKNIRGAKFRRPKILQPKEKTA